MPSRDATGKRLSGAQNKNKQRDAQRELNGAKGAPAELIGAPTAAKGGAPEQRAPDSKGAAPDSKGAPTAEAPAKESQGTTWPELPAEVRAQLTPPPKDPIDLQVWGAQTVAVLAWIAITQPRLLPKEQHNLIRNHLATMGLLFPRSEYVRRLQKLKAERKSGHEEEELKPLKGLDPGPTRRSRSTD